MQTDATGDIHKVLVVILMGSQNKLEVNGDISPQHNTTPED